ncbi:MAG: malto-oligosyltrehalose synthase [Luteitalea sp.]|nr:malto-oligosyltrehalose synthase [Luteitalea sp.]
MKAPATARVPIATYRLQLNAGFTFRDAKGVLDYLVTLGVSDCYASSYLKAVPGSVHGYDVADPTQLNPEIGTEEDYWAWIDAMTARGMGHVLDLVPNHMGIARSANPWWMDVLENGPSSRFARFFDIEWRPVKDELADKVLIPTLGNQYGVVLEKQELTLTYRDGQFVIRYFEDWFPIAPDTIVRILGPELDEWLAAQPDVIDPIDVDELRSVMTAAENLPPRSTRDPELVVVRAREKEVVKRRLGALVDRSPHLRAYIDRVVARMNGVPGNPRSFDGLDGLLNEQSYRLAHWRVASEEINYRRFFDVNQLAALRMEDPVVFDEVHRFVFDLIARGAATGLRVDHVDGLYAPGDYLRRLQERAAAVTPGEAGPGLPLYLVVEKILAADEPLPAEWPVHGTTGYEFAAVVNNLFVDRRHEARFDQIYTRFLHERRGGIRFDDIAYRSKKLIMHETMSGDINSLGHQLNRFSERNRHFRDFTLYSLISTLKEVIACFPVYRSYVTEEGRVTEHDRRSIVAAIGCAKRRAPSVAPLVFDFVEQLLLETGTPESPDECEMRARLVGKFQQITSPVAAKGIEDTTLYIYNRLLSLNEVGSQPTRFGLDPEAVHAWMERRRQQWPAALSATSTHDTKRGEDVRARLNVLSEVPEEWRVAVATWRGLNRRFKTELNGAPAPDANEEYLIYQTLVGAWPFDPQAEGELVPRMKAYVLKAIREAKVHTSWLKPEEAYEAAVLAFVDAILQRQRPFLAAFRPFQARVAELGIYNSLSQLLIKVTAPGVPDFYQGTELWDLSLVDPDNRRPVDYALRARLLAEVAAGPGGDAALARSLLDERAIGRIKLFTAVQALRTRADIAPIFRDGSYLPLGIAGHGRNCIFAFARRHESGVAITCVPRLIASVVGSLNTPPIGPDVWRDTRILLPADLGSPALRDVFTATSIPVRQTDDEGMVLDAATVFARFPVALLRS